MDGAVDKDPTRELRIFHEEPAGIQFVAGLRAEHTRTTNLAALHLVKRITVRSIESTAETADDFLRRTASLGGTVGVDNSLALYRIQLDMVNERDQQECSPLPLSYSMASRTAHAIPC